MIDTFLTPGIYNQMNKYSKEQIEAKRNEYIMARDVLYMMQNQHKVAEKIAGHKLNRIQLDLHCMQEINNGVFDD